MSSSIWTPTPENSPLGWKMSDYLETRDLVVTNLYLAYAQVAPRRMRPHIRRLARLAKG